MAGSQGKMPAPGPLGRNLIANVEYLRQARGLSLRKLSAELERVGRTGARRPNWSASAGRYSRSACPAWHMASGVSTWTSSAPWPRCST